MHKPHIVPSRLAVERMHEEAALDRALELLAEREQEVEQLRAALALEKHENARWEHIADELETKLVECQRLLREAVGWCDRTDMFELRSWREAARAAGGEHVDMPTT